MDIDLEIMDARSQILVTGGTGTLGAAIVAALRARGNAVTANYCRDAKRAQGLAQATGCDLYRADMRDECAVQTLFESRRFGGVIHAAGAAADALVARTSPASWRAGMRWLDAAFLVTRASLQFLPAGASLTLIASRVGERGGAGQAGYAATKGAMSGLMQAAARERRDLRINAICPGYAPSELSENLSEIARARRARDDMLPSADARESLAQFCLWLLASNVSGQILRPDCRENSG